MKILTNKEKCDLRGKAHKLKPVVIMGSNGLTDAVQKEIDRALDDHELIKIRINAEEREQKQQIIAAIIENSHAELIQVIGHIIAIYRKDPTKEQQRKKVISKQKKAQGSSKLKKR